jgi:hypothetical protein
MPMITLTGEQLEQAMCEYLNNATVSALLARVARAVDTAKTGDPLFDDISRKASRQLGRMSEYVGAKEDSAAAIPPCAASMGCLCAAHARGAPASSVCNATE